MLRRQSEFAPLIRATYASLILGILVLGPVVAAPVTAEDVAKSTATWESLATSRVHNYDLAEQGVKMQLALFDTAFLEALMPALAKQEGFPTDPEAVASIVNAMKPHEKSMILYLAVRDREKEPTYWSPVFGIIKQSFVMRLAADANMTPFSGEVVSPIGFRNLMEKKPIEPTDAWRGLYILEFKNETELKEFMNVPGLLLEYRHPQKSVYLNITSIRNQVVLDATHPESKTGRPMDALEQFFEAFPP